MAENNNNQLTRPTQRKSLQWQCTICTAANQIDNTNCYICNNQRPQQQYEMLLEIKEEQAVQYEQEMQKYKHVNMHIGLDQDQHVNMDIGLDDGDGNENGSIRIRLCDQLFSLNCGSIKLSPFLSKFHNGDMKKFIELERLLCDTISNNFNFYFPVEICSLITECFHIEIPEISKQRVDIDTFNQIMQYLQYHCDIKAVSKFKFPLKDRHNMNELIADEFDIQFANELNPNLLNKLAMAASYLDIEPLFELVCVQIALTNRGHEAAPYNNMRNTFHNSVFWKILSISPSGWFPPPYW